MYGMVNKAIEQMVVMHHGEEVWEQIKEKAGTSIEVFISNESYQDELTYALVAAASELLICATGKIATRVWRTLDFTYCIGKLWRVNACSRAVSG